MFELVGAVRLRPAEVGVLGVLLPFLEGEVPPEVVLMAVNFVPGVTGSSGDSSAGSAFTAVSSIFFLAGPRFLAAVLVFLDDLVSSTVTLAWMNRALVTSRMHN